MGLNEIAGTVDDVENRHAVSQQVGRVSGAFDVPKGRMRHSRRARKVTLTGSPRHLQGFAADERVHRGIVRNHTRDRRTLFLEYEAYEEMALKQLEGLAAQAKLQFQVGEIAITHRLGRLEISETSVLIVVAAPHRAAAFDACRWLIDTLKRTVPIWKKEHFEDGAVWADGEPFPEQLTGTFSRGPASN